MYEENNTNETVNNKTPDMETNNNISNKTNTGEENSTGPVIGSIIVIVIIVLGGLYFLNERVSDDDTEMTGNEIRQEQDNPTLDLQIQGNSDEVSDIEVDLGTTDFVDLDLGLDNIDSELGL